jgi:hypothetical protein
VGVTGACGPSWIGRATGSGGSVGTRTDGPAADVAAVADGAGDAGCARSAGAMAMRVPGSWRGGITVGAGAAPQAGVVGVTRPSSSPSGGGSTTVATPATCVSLVACGAETSGPASPCSSRSPAAAATADGAASGAFSALMSREEALSEATPIMLTGIDSGRGHLWSGTGRARSCPSLARGRDGGRSRSPARRSPHRFSSKPTAMPTTPMRRRNIEPLLADFIGAPSLAIVSTTNRARRAGRWCASSDPDERIKYTSG